MEDKGQVLSIKFSPDQKTLAVHRTKHSVVSVEEGILLLKLKLL
jgi:hypothetical protein